MLSTRGFGASMPNSALIPVAEFMNHSPKSSRYYIENKVDL